MSLLKFYVRYPDGRQEEYPIDADRALIGSGAHCEIRLPAEVAKVEHVAIQVTASGVYAQAMAFDPPPKVGGVAFTQGTLLPDTPLVFDNVEVFVQAVEMSAPSRVARGKQEKTSPLILGLGALAIPMVAFLLLYEEPTSGLMAPPKKVPALWSDPVTACPQSGAAAEATAQDRFATAEMRRERSPFDARDGVAAVPLYETAAACFKASGHPEAAEVAAASAKTLRETFQREYNTHAVWLEHSLQVQNWRAAQKEVAIMGAFTEGKKGEYVTWLSNMERYLRVKYGTKRT
ncbi:MAG: hypothetical protein EOO74_01970 [Myxococcales bacterium]|nr:MAG: hypothetical protein EOO74_01970 [Myxococcales bacterium]